jgi:hypothetical protein
MWWGGCLGTHGQVMTLRRYVGRATTRVVCPPDTPSQRASHTLCWSAHDWRVLMVIVAWGEGVNCVLPPPPHRITHRPPKNVRNNNNSTPPSLWASTPPPLHPLDISVIKSQKDLDDLIGGPPEFFPYTHVRRLLTHW